jgi:mannose-6-phosphate isomerase-like protein (cupin superfamily)
MSRKPWRFKLKNLGGVPSRAFQGMKVKSLISKEETEEMVAYHIRIPRNTRIAHSHHKVAHEVIFILSGSGTAHLNEERFPVKAKDVVLIRPGTWHSFSAGHEALEALAVLSPRVDGKTDLYHR